MVTEGKKSLFVRPVIGDMRSASEENHGRGLF